MTFTRGRQQDTRPLFSVAALVFDNGVLDRLTVDTGLVTVTADLQSLEHAAAPELPVEGGRTMGRRAPDALPDLTHPPARTPRI